MTKVKLNLFSDTDKLLKVEKGIRGGAMLPVEGFKWVENLSQVNKDFIKHKMKIVMKDIYWKLMFKILKSYKTFTMICHFYLKE